MAAKFSFFRLRYLLLLLYWLLVGTCGAATVAAVRFYASNGNGRHGFSVTLWGAFYHGAFGIILAGTVFALFAGSQRMGLRTLTSWAFWLLAAVSWNLLLTAGATDQPADFNSEFIAFLIVLFWVTALPLLALQFFFQWRIERKSTEGTRLAQCTILDLFLLTTLFAISLALLLKQFEPEHATSEIYVAALIYAFVGAVAGFLSALALLILRPGRLLPRVAHGFGFVVLCTAIPSVIAFFNGYPTGMFTNSIFFTTTEVFCLYSLATGAIMLILRLLGFRLYRREFSKPRSCAAPSSPPEPENV